MWAVNMLSGESRKSVAVASAVRLLLRPLDWREYKQVTVLPGACSDRRDLRRSVATVVWWRAHQPGPCFHTATAASTRAISHQYLSTNPTTSSVPINWATILIAGD